MLVLTGQGLPDRLHKESHQVMDVVQMFRPVTKWAHQIINANNIPEVVRKAARLTRTEKPGAVLLELPEDIAEHETTAEPIKASALPSPRTGRQGHGSGLCSVEGCQAPGDPRR